MSKRAPRAAFRFPDGSTVQLPATVVEQRLQGQHRRMAESDDPLMRERGRRLVEQDAAAAVEGRLVKVRARAASTRPRGKDPQRQRILDALRPDKLAGVQFKVLFERWVREPIGGLAIEPDGARYRVIEERTEEALKIYSAAMLEKLYSNAG